MKPLHSELKPLKANLLRYNFIEYFKSDSFRILLIEKDFDEIFENAFQYYNQYNNKEKNIDAYLHVLNSLIYLWIEAEPNSNLSKGYSKTFIDWVSTFILGYFEWKEDKQEISRLIDSIKKIGLVETKDIDSLEEKIKIVNNLKTKEKDEKLKTSYENINTDMTKETPVEYAIITALEEVEMEMALTLFEQEYEVENTENYIVFGHLKANSDKKVVYASQHASGMVDAAILTTEILIRFSPKYLIMLGVLGGKPVDTNIGDVVIATKVFETDRGKLTDIGFQKETSSTSITSRDIKRIHREKSNIEGYIDSEDNTRKTNVKLHFGPIATVNQVVNLDGFFEKNISELERKAVALEMESFAVVRSCQLVNSGKTVPIIIKSVMDNTKEKSDKNKTYAAWTSVKTLEYILDKNIM